MRLPGHTAVPALACAAAAILLPTSLLGFLAHDQVSFGAWTHFAGVGLTALTATLAAVALTIVGARRNDGRTVLLGTAFTAMAALLAIHGLATPGIILPYNGLVGFTGAATLPIGGAVLALSALPSLRRPRGVGRLLILQALILLAIAGLGTACMLRPSLLSNIPKPGTRSRWRRSPSRSSSTASSSFARSGPIASPDVPATSEWWSAWHG